MGGVGWWVGGGVEDVEGVCSLANLTSVYEDS